jgi:hypothetical protein
LLYCILFSKKIVYVVKYAKICYRKEEREIIPRTPHPWIN